MLKKLILQYKKLKNDFSLKIKIHPTSERYNEYKKILDKYETDVQLLQHEDLYQLIIESDIILTNSSSTAAIITTIMKKPVIIWNYFHVYDDILLKNNVALECQNISELENCLKNAQLFTTNNQLKINNFVNDHCGTGNSIINIIDEIEKKINISK
jgi:CDP-glycerol glycerophosphotransferase (TagB/SpsB family)